MKKPINQPIITLCFLTFSLLLSQGAWAQEVLAFIPATGGPGITEVSVNWSNWNNTSWPVASGANVSSTYVSYSSSDTAIATVASDGTVTVVAYSGVVTITAHYTGSDMVIGDGSYTLTIVDNRTSIDGMGFTFNSSSATATYGDANVALPTLNEGQVPAGNGQLVDYASSNTGVANVNASGQVSIVSAGTAVITATFLGDDLYKPGDTSYTLVVNPKEVGLSWGTTDFTYDGSAHAPTATATGLVGNDACTVTVEGAQTDAGSNYIATASVLSNTNYKLPTDNTTTFSIAKAASSVTTAPTANTLTYSGSAQALVTAGAASGGTMQYSLDNQTFAESVPTGIKVGSYTVYYKVVGDANHENAEGGQVVVAIAKADATVAFASKTASGKIGEAFTAPKVTTSPADLTLSYTSSNTKVATVDASTGAVTLVSAGETTITASFAGNDNYNAANDSYTLTVAKADAVNSDLSFASATAHLWRCYCHFSNIE